MTLTSPSAVGVGAVCRWCGWAIVFICSSGGGFSSPAAEPDAGIFQVAFSRSLFTDINENDAKASVKAWAQTIGSQLAIPTRREACILKGLPALLAALRNKSVDAIGMTTVEYAALSQEIAFDPIFVTYNAGRPVEQYLLLVHRDRGIDQLADLRGGSLLIHQNARHTLAEPWLDILLAHQTCPPAQEFFGRTARVPKPAKTVLPVFFRKTDACLVSRAIFETMEELNPQLGKQLTVLNQSPELVPTLFCFRADYSPPFKERLLSSIRALHSTVAGRQVLAVFQSDKLEDRPAACLQSALDILAEHARIRGATNLPFAQQPRKESQQP